MQMHTREYNVDTFFEEPGQVIGLGVDCVDPRYFLLTCAEFLNRYNFIMSSYGIENNRPYWRSGQNIPVCSTCRANIVDSSHLRKKYGINYCPGCFTHMMENELRSMPADKILDARLVYFFRVAGILDKVPKKRIQQFMTKCLSEAYRHKLLGM